MQLDYSELDHGIRLITMYGVLDATSVERIERKLREFSAGQGAVLILDLSEVSFIASIGIRLLLAIAKSVGSQGGRLALLTPISGVFEILNLTGIDQIIPIYLDLEEAKLDLIR
jgi:anti-anti-sigma factor